MRPPITMPTVKILAFFALFGVVGVIMVDLLLHLTLWWWVPITIAAFAILNIAAWRVMPTIRKADRKELLLALVIGMMVAEAIKWWWR